MCSRSRKPEVIIVVDPSSMPPVAAHTRWEAMRLNSVRITRTAWARSGTSMSSSFSTPRQYAVSLNSGAR